MFPSRSVDGPIREVQKAVQRLRERCGCSFNAHDLRRTAATRMADAGVSESVIGKVLNHSERSVTRRHYNRHAYRDEKRKALESWALYLEVLLANQSPETSRVVAFRR